MLDEGPRVGPQAKVRCAALLSTAREPGLGPPGLTGGGVFIKPRVRGAGPDLGTSRDHVEDTQSIHLSLPLMWGDLLSGTKRTGSGLLSQADGAGGSRDGARLRCPVASETASGGSNSHQCLEPTRQPGGGAHGAARAGSCDPSLVRGIRHPSGQALSAATLVGTVPGVGGQSAVATSSLGQQFGPGPILEPALGDSPGEREPTRRRSGNRESSPPVECVVIEMPVRAADASVHSMIGGRCLGRPRLRETTPQGGERRGGWGMGRAGAESLADGRRQPVRMPAR